MQDLGVRLLNIWWGGNDLIGDGQQKTGGGTMPPSASNVTTEWSLNLANPVGSADSELTSCKI